jgi:hypothetical protein
MRQRAVRAGDRLRLLPPYREHLSQAFARYFMRVGLPQDIPRSVDLCALFLCCGTPS